VLRFPMQLGQGLCHCERPPGALTHYAVSGVTILAATTADQVANWDPDRKHGLFTAELLDALVGAAGQAPYGNGDATVTLYATPSKPHRLFDFNRLCAGDG